eukprot:CAMPEP_0206592394 /NCGR_PEP_ID=MMETSP0325_2-20121206/40935_1 /ASSEMBLY_ACC=CAM_ASM_000347 /TAXON_ID=2866 /ORGANISM="Crypthecodinium cohnii, Strain Seligo" /LENGTH=34 /DNA_ID= /DNA_START= /DNA_END= /DNA_ORIENTATION=
MVFDAAAKGNGQASSYEGSKGLPAGNWYTIKPPG